MAGSCLLVLVHRRAALMAVALALGLTAACAPPTASEVPTPTTTTSAPVTTTTTTTVSPGGWTCPAWTAVSANTVTDNRISEASGLAASRLNPGLWWVQNDGPDSTHAALPSVYALDGRGRVTATVDLNGATNVDWEDIDAVNVGGTSYLWVADVGDNGKDRPSVQLYRIPEPTITSTGQVITITPDVVTLTYPGGAKHNVETTFVDPTNSDVYLVTKELPPLVFKAPAAALQPGATIALGASITTLDTLDHSTNPAAKPTGGDMSADGSLLAIKTLDRTFLWHRSPGQSIQNLLSNKPAGDCIYDAQGGVQQGISPRLPDLGQGEAIAFSPDAGQAGHHRRGRTGAAAAVPHRLNQRAPGAGGWARLSGVDHRAVVIGAGHNGLICAAYLARAGLDVLLVEARSMVGGCASTVDALGARVNICTCDHAVFRTTPVMDELDLAAHGLEYLDVDPAQLSMLHDGGPAWPTFHDPERTLDALSLTYPGEVDGYRRYLRAAMPVAELLIELANGSPTPGSVLRRVAERRARGVHHLLRWSRRSVAEVLRGFFREEAVMAPAIVVGPAVWGCRPTPPALASERSPTP